MKTYRLIYLTKENDTLREEIGEYFDIKDARKAAAVKLANSNLNDLVKIKVMRVLQNHKGSIIFVVNSDKYVCQFS